MSSGPVRRISPKDIQVVQNLIERCLQLYMNRREVVQTLLAQAKIEPGFTELVWQKLEEENRDFFKAYYLRLMVKHQIMQFNKLLEQQVQLMQGMKSSVPPMRTNGSQIPPLQQNSDFYALEHFASPMKPESRHHTLGSTSQNLFTNGGSSLNSKMHSAVDMSVHDNRIDVPGNVIPMQSSNIGLMQGINGGMIKLETGYSGTSPYMLDGSLLEARQSVVDASLASFSSVESTQNVPLLDADTTTFGFLGHTPGNFSLLDLSNDFAQSSDILESYSARSPFVGTENENFLDSHEREQGNLCFKYLPFGHFTREPNWFDNAGEGKRLDGISEGMSYDEFGSQ